MRSRLGITIAAALLSGVFAACGSPAFTEDMVLGGETVSAARLNRGKELYMLNCYACHGEQGNGKGPAAAFLRPPPRDFASGSFKFGLAIEGLPHTEDLVHLVRRGLTGTAMMPWDVPPQQLADIVSYIKTFSWAWKCEKTAECEDKCSRPGDNGETKCYSPQKLGKQVEMSKDPWVGRTAEAIDRGSQVYHTKALCRTCHPSYITQEKLYEITRGPDEWAYADLVYRAELKRSDTYKTSILPIDFLFNPIKNLQAGDDDQTAREHLYRVIGAGVVGAAMPVWKGAIPDEDLWSLSYYVHDLWKKRGTPEALAMRDSLTHQTPFVPPAPEGDAGEGAAGENPAPAEGGGATP